METSTVIMVRKVSSSFKSYYVVWKQFSSHLPTADIRCLNRTMQYGNTPCSYRLHLAVWVFKSYYVVWKPYFLCCRFSYPICLNRTMQYGNLIGHSIKIIRYWFKSYYVVWKRQISRYFVSCGLRLNRTMQYGNKKKITKKKVKIFV